MSERSAKYRRDNIDQLRHLNREYYKNNKERFIEYQRKYYTENTDKIKKTTREYRINNIEKIKERNANYHKNNKDKRYQLIRNRRARLASAGGTHTKDDVVSIYKDQNEKCFWCDKDLNGEYHDDHFYPISKGGSNDKSNIVVACPTCNMRKNNKDPEEWMEIILSEMQESEL